MKELGFLLSGITFMVKEINASNLFRPLTILFIIGGFVLLAGGAIMAHSVDKAAKAHEQRLIANGISSRIAEIRKNLATQAKWDGRQHLLARQGGDDWVEHFTTQHAKVAGDMPYTFILDGKNRLFFASDHGNRAQLGLYTLFAPAMHRGIDALRRAEATGNVKTMRDEPLQTQNVARIRGKIYILVASLAEPHEHAAARGGQPAPIIVSATPVDRSFLTEFGNRYLLRGINLRQMQMGAIAGVAQVDINDDRGRYVATLEWRPARPGTALAIKLLPPVLVVLALFLSLMWVMQRRSWRMAQELIASEARASHLAYHDPLTGLPNRVMFFDRLKVALDQVRRGGAPAAILCLDLDRFKEVNDTFGHQMGDELIVAASRRIAEICRRSDTFARLSGDEFAIVQLDASPVAASRLAERIVEAMSQPVELSGGRVHTSCSIGVNIVTEGEVSAAEALRHADLALYRAKHNGRSQYCFFEPEMDAAMRVRRELELDLRDALKNGGLRMVYQPQADRNGRIIGVEALLRWHHPQRGDVAPAMFVQIAEECGLINEIGVFTLREAFKASRNWDGLKVAVNISASQLRMRDFSEKVSELLQEYKIDPRSFELEITEGLLLGDDPVTHETLMKLRQMGFSIALDDFGTGYSSLSYLQRYPIDKIKIDRSFIANLGVEWESRAVVQAIVKLARALRLDVIAEGVETEEQREYLVGVGCEEIQGFLYSRPVEADQVAEMYDGRRALTAARA